MPRPSTGFLFSVVAVVSVFIFVLLPFFVGSKGGGGQDLVLNLHVVDSQTNPIPKAKVMVSRGYVGERFATTDSRGNVTLQKAFVAYSSCRRRFGPFGTSVVVKAHCTIDSIIRVEADGYRTLEIPLSAVFGARYEYSKHGTNLSHTIRLAR